MALACQHEVHCYKILLLQCQVTWLVMEDMDTEVKIPPSIVLSTSGALAPVS